MRTVIAILLLSALSVSLNQASAQVGEREGQNSLQTVDRPLLRAGTMAMLPALYPPEVKTTRAIIRPLHVCSPEAFNKVIDLIDETYHLFDWPPDNEPAPENLLARSPSL